MTPMRLPALAFLAALMALPAAAQQRAGNNSGTVVLPGGNGRAPVTVNSEKLEYFDKEQKLIYSGGVVAKQGDSTLKAAVVVVFLSSGAIQPTDATAGGNQIKRMEASGGVSIVSKDQVGTGDNGTYDRQRNEVVLIGNVSLSQGGTVIKGLKDSRLVYDLNTSQAVIVGGVSSIITPGSEDGRKDEAPRKPAAR